MISLSGCSNASTTYDSARVKTIPSLTPNTASTDITLFIAGLLPQSPRNFARQHSARVSHTLQSSYLSHVITAAT